MEIQLTPERQAQLAEWARRQGRDPSEVADEALAKYLEDVEEFAEAVERGRDAAREGAVMDHEAVGRMLASRYRSE